MSETTEVCRINIGPRERARRRRFGVIMSVISVACAVALLALRFPAVWRLALWLPLTLAGFGWFQAYEKT